MKTEFGGRISRRKPILELISHHKFLQLSVYIKFDKWVIIEPKSSYSMKKLSDFYRVILDFHPQGRAEGAGGLSDARI